MKVWLPERAHLAESSLLSRKTLWPRRNKNVVCKHVAVGLPIAILVAGLILSIRYLPDADNKSCESYTAETTQKVFIIDVPIATELSYSAARGLDIAWDLVVSQGGRILHAWILCAHVIPAAVTRLLERSTLPYEALVHLSFSPGSLKTLVPALKAILRQPRQLPVILWLCLAIVYCLLFPTLSGATTGYYTDSARMFRMPDGSFVDEKSALLSQCWVIDDPRLGDLGRRVIIGGTYSSIDNAWYSGSFVPQDPIVADNSTVAAENLHPDYLDITAYVETQAFLQLVLQSWCANVDNGNTSFVDLTSLYPRNMTIFDFVLDLEAKTVLIPSNCTLPREVELIQICGPQTPGCITFAPPTELEADKDPYDLAFFPPWEFNGTRNMRVSGDGPLAAGSNVQMPFSSTLWLNHTQYNLSAPTLNPAVGCKSYNGLTCSCYNGEAISYDYQGPEHTQCIASSLYGWGISRVIMMFVIGLELAWIVGCYAIWLHAEMSSVLLQHSWKTSGDVTSALVIAARIEADLGPEAFAYSQKELKEALGTCDDVGHRVLRTEDGGLEVGVMAASGQRKARRNDLTESKRGKRASLPSRAKIPSRPNPDTMMGRIWSWLDRPAKIRAWDQPSRDDKSLLLES